MTQRARFCRGTATVVLALAALGGFPGTWAATESDVRQDQAQAPGTPQLRASIRIEPAADPAATQTAPQSAGGAAPAPSSTTTAVLGQPLNVVVDVPAGSVTGTKINVTVSEPFGKSTVLVLTAQPGTSNGFTTFTTQAPVSFGGGRGGFTGPGDLYYQTGTINDLVQNNGDALTFTVTTPGAGAQTSLFVYDNWIQQGIAMARDAADEAASNLLDERLVIDSLLADPSLEPELRDALEQWKNGLEYRSRYLKELRDRWARARTPYETYATGRSFLPFVTGQASPEDFEGAMFALRKDIDSVHDLNIQRGWTAGVMGLYAVTAAITGADLWVELAEGKDILGNEVNRGYVVVKIGAAILLFKAYQGLLDSLTGSGLQIYRGSGTGGSRMNISAFGWSPAEFLVQQRTARLLAIIGGRLKLTGTRVAELHQRISARLRGARAVTGAAPAPAVSSGRGALPAAPPSGAASASSGGFNPTGSLGDVKPPAGRGAEPPGFGSAVNDSGSWQSADTLGDAPGASGRGGRSGGGSSGSIIIEGLGEGSSGGPPVGWNSRTASPVQAIRTAMQEARQAGVRKERITEIIGQEGGSPQKILSDLRNEIDYATALNEQINRFMWAPSIQGQLGRITNFARANGVSQQRINEIGFNQPNEILRGQQIVGETLVTMGYTPVTRAEFLRVNGIYVRARNQAMTPDDLVYLQDQLSANPNYFSDLTRRGYVSLQNQGFDAVLNKTSAADLEMWFRRATSAPGFSFGGRGGAFGLGGSLALGLGLSRPAKAGEAIWEGDGIDTPLSTGRFVLRLSDIRSTGMTSIDAAPTDNDSQTMVGEKSALRFVDERIVIAGGLPPRERRSWADAIRSFAGRLFAAPAGLRAAVTDTWPAAAEARRRPGSGSSSQATATVSPPKVRVVLTSLGRSMGEAFRLTVINDGTSPVEISPDLFVLEPVARISAAEVERQIASVPAMRRADVSVTGYCLQMLKAPPVAGQVFRLAPPDRQARAGTARRILQASRELARSGLLRPDSDPAEYFNAIRQWALWADERGFNEGTFTSAFVDHSRKAIVEAGRQVTPAVERALRQLAPNRWRDIQLVLREAAQWPERRAAASR